MDISMSTDEISFRDKVRATIAEKLEPDWREVCELASRSVPAVANAWQKVMATEGWLTANWPAEYGGHPWTPLQFYILKSELARARAPAYPHLEFGMVAPLIYTFGTKAQKDYLLPRLLSGEDTWCQGFSEPGSGSDLASLKTIARREGDSYLVNGQKIWTSFAHRATQMFALFRTDPNAARPQAGISMFVLPMSSPGITVRPIIGINGGHHLNEVFFDDVRIPATSLLGEENKGWDCARFLLIHERSGIAEVQGTRGVLTDVAAIVDMDYLSHLAEPLAALLARLEALETFELQFMEMASRNVAPPHFASMLKVIGSELRQEALALGQRALGPLAEIRSGEGAPQHPSGRGRHMAGDALFYRAASIYGGTNEVQRNIIAKTLLRDGAGV